MESTAVRNNLARLSFGWEGPTILTDNTHVSEIELEFDGERRYLVDLNESMNPTTPQSFPFKYLTPSIEVWMRGKTLFILDTETETNTNVLSTTLDRIRSLSVTAHFCKHVLGEPGIEINLLTRQLSIVRPLLFLRWREDFNLEIPQDLAAGKLYQLVISSDGDFLSASFVEQANRSSETKDSV